MTHQDTQHLSEIKVKVTNTTNEAIENVEVFAPINDDDDYEAVTIKSLVQNWKYPDMLSTLISLPTTKFTIELVGVGENKETAYTKFGLHTFNLNKGDYSGRTFAPSMKSDSEGSWVSPKPAKWGGKNKVTKMILNSLPANSSVIIILTPYVEKEVLEPPVGADNKFLNVEVVSREKITMMKVEQVVDKLKEVRPVEIFSLKYSNEKPFFKVIEYDDEQEGLILTCAAWKKGTPESFYTYDDFYKLLKKEGLKELCF